MESESLALEKYENESMGTWYHVPQIMSFIKENRDAGVSFLDIKNSIEKKFKRHIRSEDYLRKKYTYVSYNRTYFDNIVQSKDVYVRTYTDIYKEYDSFIERAKIKSRKKQTEAGKIIVAGDFHSPFHNLELLAHLITHHSDAEYFIGPGDIFDCYSFSRFDKDIDINIKEELAVNTVLIDSIASIWKNVKLQQGNHTDRVGKYFRQRVPTDMMFLVETDILSLVSKKHKNIEIISDKYEFDNGMGYALVGHFHKHGNDMVIGHFENAKKTPVKTVQECYNHLVSWDSYYKLLPIKLFLQAHTHSLGKWYRHGGSLVIGETGCCCKIQSYQTKPKIGWEPNTPGYWVVYQDKDGNTDLNRSRPFSYYGE